MNDANARTLSRAKLQKQIKDANAKLRATKQAIVDAEAVLETRHAARTFAIEDLGTNGRSGGQAAKKQRYELFDRLARLGQGLSAPQRNDFAWF